MLEANKMQPNREVIDNHRQGNCTSCSFGTIAHTGRLTSVVIRKENRVKAKTALRVLLISLRNSLRKSTTAGEMNAKTARARMLANQVFRFVSAAEEKTKLAR